MARQYTLIEIAEKGSTKCKRHEKQQARKGKLTPKKKRCLPVQQNIKQNKIFDKKWPDCAKMLQQTTTTK